MPGLPRKADGMLLLAATAAALVLAAAPGPGFCRAAEEPGKNSVMAGHPGPVEDLHPHQSVRRFALGDGPRSYLLFEPADPQPERAAVVVFLHGWFAVNPAFYGAWIDHLVREGN